MSAEQRHATAYTLSKYVPPEHPPVREAMFKVRRVIQRSFNLVQDSKEGFFATYNVIPKNWFDPGFNTNDFDELFLHRVSAWSEIVVPGTGQTVWPVIRLQYYDSNNQGVKPTFQGHAAGYNLRARAGFHVPNHLSGPFNKNSTSTMVQIEAWSSASEKASFPVQSVTVEVDATFC